MKRPCHPHERTCADSALSFKMMALMVGLFGVLAVTLQASSPAWWSSTGTGSQSAVVTTQGTNQYVTINQGQVKQFTIRAVDALNSGLTNYGGAGPALTNLVYGWKQDYATNGYATNTAYPTHPYKASDYQGMNLGQLKYIGNLVWNRLETVGYTNTVPLWLNVNPTNDYHVANAGQLKAVFNFDLSSFSSVPHISAPASVSGTVGTALASYSLTTTNSPTSFSVSGLPVGFTFNTNSGVISGTPYAAGTYSLMLGASNSYGSSYFAQMLNISAAIPVINSATSASATVGTFFTYRITATNNPVSFSATSLPTGLSVDSATGYITGTPTSAGTSTVTLGATNADGGTASAVTLTITVSNPAVPVITGGTANGAVGAWFTYTITATNHPTSFSATALPSWLSLNTSTGQLTGTPTAATTGTSVTLNATNAGGSATPATLTLVIGASGSPVITSGSTAYAFHSSTFTYQIVASNTPTSYGASSLPAGLSVNTGTGVISGTPSDTGLTNYASSITATNSSGTGSAPLNFTVNLPLPTLPTSPTATGYVGLQFYYAIPASNSPTSFSAASLPAGLSIDTNTGVISGVPSAAGTSSITIGETNPAGTSTATLTLTVSFPLPVPVITSGTTVSATIGSPFNYAITVGTIPAPTSYAQSGLPTGLSLNTSTGVLTGTPSGSPGTSYVTLSATNSQGETGTALLTIVVNPAGAPVITSAATATGTVGSPFSYSITAANSPTGFTATGLPPGLGINTGTGAISGTPSVVGASMVMLGATNSVGTASSSLVLTVNQRPPAITSPTTISATFGTAITPYVITASNGPTSFSASGLPPGLVLDAASGTILGTPIASGTYNATISATNAGGTGSTTLTFTIASWNNSQPIVTRSIAAGDYYTLALKSDGTVWATGYNLDGELGNGGDPTTSSYTKVSGLSGVVAVASEGYASLALKNDGTVWAWGSNPDGELGNNTTASSSAPVQVLISGTNALTGVIAIAGGEYFGLALKSNGTVWAWGQNGNGQLGTGTTTPSLIAQQVTSLSGIVSIACGGYHAMAVDSSGNLWTWGANESGQLGNGTITQSTTPVEVTALSGVASIAGGGNAGGNGGYSIAVKNDGTVWDWGTNSVNDGNVGLLGNGSTVAYSSVPVQVSNLSRAISVSASHGSHTLVLKSDGTVWAWGQNVIGQLGNTTTTDSNVPVQVSNLTGVVALTSGLTHNVAVKSDGSLWGWGSDTQGELGVASPATQTATPTTVSNLSGISAIAAARYHYLALKSDGTVWTWDDTTPGEVSDGTTVVGSPSGVQVAGLSNIAAIACGTYFNLALDSTGNVWAWGRNNSGQLANGTNTDNQVPAQISGLSGISAIACGGSYGMALKSDGTTWTWGLNSHGELGNGSTTSSNTAAQIPSGSLSSITAITSGANHPLVLKSGGTVWTWGANYKGELGTGAFTPVAAVSTPTQVTTTLGTNIITSVSPGYFHSLAIKNDGTNPTTVWAWGDNTVGELGNGTTTSTNVPVAISNLTGFTKIASGEDSYFSIGLKSDGSLWGWGSNSNGQLGTGIYGSIDGISPTGTSTPNSVVGLGGATITGIACGKYSTIALKSDGTVLEWGDTSYEPTGFSIPVPLGSLLNSPAPSISPAGGSYTSSQTVTLATSIPSGVIHYTLNGNQPTAADPTYSSPFSLTVSALVSADVFVGTTLSSPVSTAQFYINDTTGLPVQPTSLASSASGTDIALSWSLSGQVNYSAVNVWRSSDGGTTYQLIATLPASATTYDDTNVQYGTSYKYYVGTLNTSGEKDTSPTSSVTPSATTPLSIYVTTPSGATNLP